MNLIFYPVLLLGSTAVLAIIFHMIKSGRRNKKLSKKKREELLS